MRRSLHPSFGQASGVRAALHPSGALAASGGAPVWTAAPVISGEPWPGGTVDGTPGTPPSAATYEYKIGGVGTGDTSYLTFAPTAAQYTGSLTLVGDASGVAATSNALSLQRVRGITRPAIDADYPRSAVVALPASDVTFIFEGIFSASATSGRFGSCYDLAAARGIIVERFGTNAFFRVRIHTSASTITDTSAAIPGNIDGVTRLFLAVTYDGANARIHVAAAAGSVTTTTVAATGDMTAANAQIILFQGANATAGTMEARTLTRVLSAADVQAVIDSPIGLASLDGDADILAELYPAPGTAVEGDAITTVAEITGCASINAGTARLTDGGLNVAN